MKNIPFFILLLLVFGACNSDDNADEINEEIEENFFALKVGNTWTYNYFSRVGQTEEFENLGAVDQVTILSKTEINGETYFEMQTTTILGDQFCTVCPDEGVANRMVRDSLGYLIDTEGVIIFSSQDVDTDYLILEFEQYDIFGKLLLESELISVEAGNFECLKNEVFAVFEADGSISQGRDYIYFADGVGQTLRKYSGVMNPQHRWEKRLMNFTISE